MAITDATLLALWSRCQARLLKYATERDALTAELVAATAAIAQSADPAVMDTLAETVRTLTQHRAQVQRHLDHNQRILNALRPRYQACVDADLARRLREAAERHAIDHGPDPRRKRQHYVSRVSRDKGRDVQPTPSDRLDCSLAGWDPPWQWTWNGGSGIVPFSQMKLTPTSAVYAGDHDDEWQHARTLGTRATFPVRPETRRAFWRRYWEE